MQERTRQKWVWGWLRLALGLLQMAFAVAGVGALLALGMHWLTYLSVGIATGATVASRLLYRGGISP
jgi:hypothetical protein